MRFLPFTALLLLAVLLTGCAQGVWTKPGATSGEFTSDRAQCDYEAELATPDINTYNRRGSMGDAIASGIADGIATGIRKGTLLHKCMVARGWIWTVQQPASYGKYP